MVQDINHTIYTTKTQSEFSNMSVTAGIKGLHTGAGWAWSTHAASLLPAAGSMQTGLRAATANGQRNRRV